LILLYPAFGDRGPRRDAVDNEIESVTIVIDGRTGPVEGSA
jgi:hypothetical protein